MRIMLLAAIALAGCTSTGQLTPQAQQIANNMVANGQLFCAMQTATGPLVVALADAAGTPVTATNKGASVVQAACAVIGAIPVAPPANPAQAPVVAAPVPAAAKS